MKKKDIMYENEDFFMIRTPLKSYQIYKDLFSDNDLNRTILNLNNIFLDDVFLESIYTTSEDLFNSITKQTQLPIYNEKILSSALKYFIRMSTRTTPFGLFSGIGLGNFSNETNFLLNDPFYYVKRARPSMEWIFSLISKLEQDKSVLRELILKPNNSIHPIFNRLELLNNTCLNVNSIEKTEQEQISIKNSELVQYVLNKSKSGIKYKDLKKLLLKKYSVEYEKNIVVFLDTLLKKEFLITELRPPLTCVDSLDYIISKIPNTNYITELNNIKNLIISYNLLLIGNGEKLFSSILESMKKVTIAKKYIQIDTKLDLKSSTLNKNIKEDICRFATSLAYISSIEKNDILDEYKIAFIGRYDAEREVRLLDLIDSDSGIGYPNWKSSIENNEKLSSIILNKIIEGISKRKEVSFTLDDFISLIDLKNKENLIESAELNIIIKAKSQKDIDSGKYELFLGPNLGSNDTCKTFGRFVDILNQDEKNKIKIAQKNDIDKTDNTLIVGLNFIPKNPTISNIAINQNYREYEVTLATNNSLNKIEIDLNNIVVGIYNNKFYLRDIKLNKFIKIKSDNMVNTRYIPKIFKLLYYISNEGKSILPSSFFKIFNMLDYIPKIKIENITLQPAQWKFSRKSFLNNSKKLDLNTFKSILHDLVNELNIPSYVYQVKYDNRLLFNLNNELHLKELFNILKKEGTITLTEIDFDDLWIRDINNKPYTSEFVFPIRLKKDLKDFKYNNSLNILKNRFLSYDVSQREQFLGGNWIYLKFYSMKEFQDDLLMNELKPLCIKLLDGKYIDEFFFIRYVDSKNHIRLRLKGNKNIITQKVLPELNYLINKLKLEQKVYRVTVDTYRREVERYGGIELISLVETIFYYDSLMVLELLALNKEEFSLDDLAICSIVNYLNSFNLNLSEQITLLDEVVDYSFNRKNFNLKRKFYTSICNLDDKNILLKYEKVSKYLKLRDLSIKIFNDKLNKIENCNKLTNSKNNIYNSILHLHCNRIFGVDRIKEKEVLTLVRNSLYVLKNLKEKKR